MFYGGSSNPRVYPVDGSTLVVCAARHTGQRLQIWPIYRLANCNAFLLSPSPSPARKDISSNANFMDHEIREYRVE